MTAGGVIYEDEFTATERWAAARSDWMLAYTYFDLLEPLNGVLRTFMDECGERALLVGKRETARRALRRLIFRAAFCFCDFLRFGRPDVPCGRRYPLSRTRNTTQKSGALCPASACFLYYRRCPPLRGLPVARRTFPARERQGKRAARKAPPCKFSGSLFLRSFQRSTAAALCAARGRRRCAAARSAGRPRRRRCSHTPARRAAPRRRGRGRGFVRA